MKNEILGSVQQKINNSNWNLSRFYDENALVILDKKYEIDKVSKVYPLQKLTYDDLRGRKKGDLSFVLETKNNKLGYERADLAFAGDTIEFENKPRVIRNISLVYDFLEFEDGSVLELKSIPPIEKVDFISELGSFGIKEESETKKEAAKNKQEDASAEANKENKVPTERIPSTNPSTWNGKFSVGDKVRIRIDFKEFFGKNNDTESIFTIKSIDSEDSSKIKRPENPSGLIYKLSNGDDWEGKDLEPADESSAVTIKKETKEDVEDSETPVSAKPVNRQTVEEMIKELSMVPLFIDSNYFEGKDESTDAIIIGRRNLLIINKREKPKLELFFRVNYSDYRLEGYQFSIESQLIKKDTTIYNDEFIGEVNNVPEMVNKINESYENIAKEFNKSLLESIKEELEKQKEKQKEKEQKEKEQKEKDKSEKSKGEEGEEKGEEGDGESEEGKGEAEQGREMTSEQIQKLIDQLSKDESGESESGQSSSGENIDLEDFLRDVNNGEIQDNDFGKNYNNKDLKEQIDRRSQDENKEDVESQEQDNIDDEQQKQIFFEEYTVTNVLGAIRKKFSISSEEVKRRFPTKKSISDFFEILGKSEIDEIANSVGIPKEMSNFEKQKTISRNLELELNNIENE